MATKRFESKDRDAPAGTRSGPRARAAQDRKFGAARARPRDAKDPYARAERPPRTAADRTTPYAERMRAPARGAGPRPTGAGITLDPDVARVFRDSEAVNEALRMVIRLARFAGGSARPASGFDRRPSGPPSGPRAGGSSDRSARNTRDERPRERRPSAPPFRSEPKFEDSE